MSNNLKRSDLWAYASGAGAFSITINGIGNFAMLYYTQIMGMRPELAGIALSIAIVFDAISDPLMGSISDRTTTRLGRRYPYMLIGGILLAPSFLGYWFVPDFIQGEHALFVYLLTINICLKTTLTVFVVPYTALGFEICRTDHDRARVQGVRYGFSMISNILFGGLAWVLFFGDKVTADGIRIEGTKIQENYHTMGSVLTLATLAIMIFCLIRSYNFSAKNLTAAKQSTPSSLARAIVFDFKDVYSDRIIWLVFGFFGVAQLGKVVTGQVQMFTYVEFMQFSAYEKTFVHTGGMFGFLIGSLLLGSLVKRFDKKKTGYCAMLISSLGSLSLLAIFKGGLMDPVSTSLLDIGEQPFHLSCIVFGFFQMLWWAGCGILTPLAASMIADLSTMRRLQTGQVAEGRYAAGFSLFSKVAIAVALFVTGYILKGVGYVSGAEVQTPDTINTLALMTFGVGPTLMLFSFLILRKYPITHEVMEDHRKKYGQ